ncbi:MAG: PEP-utilizing enzyme [Bacteroidales bacterium]|nr:PEP-utilizing enzyme [Bacteroidales bacterium]
MMTATTFKSQALEANLEQTRYKDIFIPEEHKVFIALSINYFGINKRAKECITEYHHPLSNHTFVTEELRKILLDDFWFYTRDDIPAGTLRVPLEMLRSLLRQDVQLKLRLNIVKTLLEFVDKEVGRNIENDETITLVFNILQERFEENKDCFILATKHAERYLGNVGRVEAFAGMSCLLLRTMLAANYDYWRQTSQVEQWITEKGDIIPDNEKDLIINNIGKPFFDSLNDSLNVAEQWDELSEMPHFDELARRFTDSERLFTHFITKFHYVFFLLHLPGMESQRERLIWNMDRMVRDAVDEIPKAEMKPFIDTVFDLAKELRGQYASAVLDFQLTLGRKIIDIDDSEMKELVNHFEKRTIEFGFITPGNVFVDEDWQLSVNKDHIKNIRVWLELIEYSRMPLDKLLSALIVNLKTGGIFISDTDLFQREITKILNSNISPYYKKVKQLARIFPVYFNEIGAEGEIRTVTTNMDEISGRQDKLVHFLRKQVHTESNNTLVDLTFNVFRFWSDGNLEALKSVLPNNVYESVDMGSTWFVHIHNIVQTMCVISSLNPEDVLMLSRDDYESLIRKAADRLGTDSGIFERENFRLMNIRDLYAYLREKYSFESVNIFSYLRNYPFISDSEIDEFEKVYKSKDFGRSLTMIYSFMEKLKDIIFNPEQSEGWENIYHKRHIAIGIPSMYGTYRENKFEAMGLSFRLERVATQLMEKVVQSINLDYISELTLNQIYTILKYFRDGLALDGITNQSLNSKLNMLRYSLMSRSFSFGQYINIFQFIAEDVRRIIIEYFIKSYEYPLKIVIPQVFDPDGRLSERETIALISRKSEEFHRDLLSDAFLMQPLDNFIGRILTSLRTMEATLKPNIISDIMTYNSEMLVSPFWEATPKMDNQVFIGNKANNLKALFLKGMPVPPGFVITTEAFRRNDTINVIPELRSEIHGMLRRYIAELEERSGGRFGNAESPLLVSVRSGTAISMPGAMDTFLNVGLNDEVVEKIAVNPEKAWAIWDSYRRFLQSWGMAKGISRDVFDEEINTFKMVYNVRQKADFTVDVMREMAYSYKKVVENHGIVIEQDPFKQIIECINMVFDSWNSERALAYRRHLGISENWGTAVIVQQMIFGNISDMSGTGVVFTQNPHRERPGVHLFGDFTMRSQGEDIVGGLVKPLPISETQRKSAGLTGPSMQTMLPEIYKKIHSVAVTLTEELGYAPQEMEFTFESDKAEDFHILQIRDQDLKVEDTENVFVQAPSEMNQIGRGIGIGGGAMNGVVAFNEDDIKTLRENGANNIILVRPDTVPDDISLIFDCEGLLTARGGATSHAAVTAVRLGKVCVVSCVELLVNDERHCATLDGNVLLKGDKIAIDGNLGLVYLGHYPTDTIA